MRAVAFPDERAFGRAAARAATTPPRPVTGVRVVLVPHHWPAGHLALAALRDATPPRGGWRRLILVGPDHPNAGAAYAATSGARWRTVAGHLAPDTAAIAALVGVGAAALDDELVAREHGVAGVLPALAWAAPGARVVPLAVRGQAADGAADTLAAALAPWVDPATLVVVSVDFAHGQPADVARSHDAETAAALAARDVARLRGWADEHLDAREALAVAIALAERVGATRYVPRDRSDGAALPDYAGGPITSYMTGYYVTD